MLVFLCTIFILGGCSDNSPEEYEDYVAEFNSLEVDELEKRILEEEQSIYVYFGTESCSFCQTFTPKLYKASKNSKTTIFYWDVKDSPENEQRNNFLDKYEIEYVPSLLEIYPDTSFKHLEIDDDISVEEIQKKLEEK